MIVGLLRNYKTPLVKDRVAAMAIKELGEEAIFFSIQDVNYNQKIIKCLKLIKGEWVEAISYFPDVVYNDIPARLSSKLYKELEDYGIPFTTHRLDFNKFQLNEIMRKDEFLSQFTIETKRYINPEQFNQFLIEHNEIVLKPNRGHKGLGVKMLTLKNDKVEVENHNGEKNLYSIEELKFRFLNQMDMENYHLQKKVNSKTRYGTPFIIRSYVGRNGKGNWINYFHYAAIRLNDNNIINVSRGSAICYIDYFLEDNFGADSRKIKKDLNEITISIANRVQKYSKPKLDALGVDIGIADDGKLYIFEVNAFPGTRPFEALVENHATRYAIFLAKNH